MFLGNAAIAASPYGMSPMTANVYPSPESAFEPAADAGTDRTASEAATAVPTASERLVFLNEASSVDYQRTVNASEHQDHI
jgi:hypothetical protein